MGGDKLICSEYHIFLLDDDDPLDYGLTWTNIGNFTSIGRGENIRYNASSNVRIPRMARVALK
jgi:hypothetical protein